MAISVDESRFIGRVRELERLTALMSDVRRARPRIALIEGDPGVGKTMLVERFAREQSLDSVLWCSGDESETQVPYALIDQLLRRAGLADSGLIDAAADERIMDPGEAHATTDELARCSAHRGLRREPKGSRRTSTVRLAHRTGRRGRVGSGQRGDRLPSWR